MSGDGSERGGTEGAAVKRRPGRPWLDAKGGAKATIFSIRVSAEERAEITAAAAAAGASSASQWARRVVIAAARRKRVAR